jgi:ferritin-like metal-binding protein YciE
MTPNSLEQQLVKYLTDAHSIEQQALEQMKRAPDIAGDPELAGFFKLHLTETEQQNRLLEERLDALGAGPAKLKDLAGKVTGVGFALFAKFQPDTPGKLVSHAYSYEHMEIATYELLARVAELAADPETVRVAREIEQQERAMAERLEGSFELAVETALRELSPDDLRVQLEKYLADAHAIEAQAIQLLGKAPGMVESSELAAAYEEHLEETRGQQQLIADRLAAHGEKPSRLKDAALTLGALNWGAFFAAQPDTPAKLAAFSYAFEHLEIGSYEQLRRVAQRVGDNATVIAADRILEQERAAAARIHSLLDQALDASLQAQGVGAR